MDLTTSENQAKSLLGISSLRGTDWCLVWHLKHGCPKQTAHVSTQLSSAKQLVFLNGFFWMLNSLLQIHFSNKMLTVTFTTSQLWAACVMCTGRIFMAKTEQTAHLITLFWHMYNTYM